MQRTIGFLLVMFPLCHLGAVHGQKPRDPNDTQIQTARLRALYSAYKNHEATKGSPASKFEDLSLDPATLKEVKERYSCDEFGASLTDTTKEAQAKLVLIFEKAALKDGGLVLLYDGTIKTLSASELKKLLKRK